MSTGKITHWDECWKVHHDCAVRKIEDLEKELTKARNKIDELNFEINRLEEENCGDDL